MQWVMGDTIVNSTFSVYLVPTGYLEQLGGTSIALKGGIRRSVERGISEGRYLRSEVSPKGCVEGRRNSNCDATLVIEYD